MGTGTLKFAPSAERDTYKCSSSLETIRYTLVLVKMNTADGLFHLDSFSRELSLHREADLPVVI